MNCYTVNGNDKWTQVSNEQYTYKIHATYSKNHTNFPQTLKNSSAFWKNFLPYNKSVLSFQRLLLCRILSAAIIEEDSSEHVATSQRMLERTRRRSQ